MKKDKRKNIIRFLINLAIIILVAIISSLAFMRWDLTEEKRYSLTPATIELLENLDSKVLVNVYLKGDYPADFKRLENATRELLIELRSYSNNNIEYQFINPSENPDKKQREKIYGDLIGAGLMYTNLPIETADGIQEKIIFPGALISQGEKTYPVQLLKSKERVPNAQMINNSINNLEFEIISAIRKLQLNKKQNIAVLEGNGELTGIEIEDMMQSLRDFYNVSSIKIDGNINAFSNVIDNKGYRKNNYDLLIIPKPTQKFSDKDRFIIDQYIMHGGKVVWLIDAVSANMDSLQNKQQTIGFPLDLNIYDMLFTYGARVNKNLLLDKTCAPIWLNVGNYGDRPNMKMFPWYFDPIIIPQGNHPIVNNIDPVLTRFTSSIDGVGDESITKTPLLQTSELTKIYNAPARINLGIINAPLDFRVNNKPFQIVAMLLQGKFESYFKFSLPPVIADADEIDFKDQSPENQMLVISDGDIIRNPVNSSDNRFFPLGYEKNAGRIIYGNKDFLLNAINFMLDDQSLISIRSKTITLRKLNVDKVLKEYRFWQIFNLVLPILMIVILGIVLNWSRKKYYSKTL
jgi:ABC-2 type transport system permease protein